MLPWVADATHNFGDVFALAVACLARNLGSRPPSLKHTYGLKRVEVVAAVLSATVLIGIAVLIIRQACSHAFYELKGETQAQALQEIVRVLTPDGVFLMMEHDVPRNRIVRALFFIRLTLIGSGRAIAFLRQEQKVLEQHFRTVEKVALPAGRSKIMRCKK